MRGLGRPSERPRRSDARSIARRRDLAASVTAGSTAPLCPASAPRFLLFLVLLHKRLRSPQTIPPPVVFSLVLGTAGPASAACVVVPVIGVLPMVVHLHKTVTRTHKLRHQQIN